MPYLHRRKKGLVDLLLEDDFKYEVTIQDSDQDVKNNTFTIVVNGYAFTTADTDPGADESPAIAAALALAIKASTLPVRASSTGSVLEIQGKVFDPNFTVTGGTTNPHAHVGVAKVHAEGYRVLKADNWDETFTEALRVPRQGAKTPGAGQETVLNHSAFSRWCRFRFNPADLGLDDDQVIFLQADPIYGGLPSGNPGRIIIILTPDQEHENCPAVILRGRAPYATNAGESLSLYLPPQTRSFELKNIDSSTTTMYLSYGHGGAEIPLAQGEKVHDLVMGSGHVNIRSGDPGGTDIYIWLSTTFNLMM